MEEYDMFRKLLFVALFSLVAIVFGYSEEYRIVVQKLEKNLKTYTSGTIVRINKQRDLLNAFGKPDIFRGKIDEGFIELKYLGKIDESNFALGIKEVTIESNETTMSRYGKSSGIVNLSTVQDFAGRYITTGNVYIQNKPEAKTYILPPDYSDFIWNNSVGNEFEIEGYKIKFNSFDSNTITFIISKQKE
jgi:hypothetical protein